MTDTLKRLSNPTRLVKNNTGSTLYTPGSTVVATVKYANVTNVGPWDAYLTLGINDLKVVTNLIVPSLVIPAYRTIAVPLDLIVTNAASDIVLARQTLPYQNSYGSTSLLQTPAVLVNGTGNSAAATTVVTGSWTSVTGTAYMLSVAWSKATAADAISSFTDTRGLSWTLVDSIISTDTLSRLSVYSAVATSASAATTTVTFGGTEALAAAAVTNVALTGTYDNTTANGVDAIVAYGKGEDLRSTTTPVLNLEGRGSVNANRLISHTANGTVTTSTAPTGWTELNDVGTNKTLVTGYSLGSTGTATSNVYTPTLAAGNGVSLAIGVEAQEPSRPLVVSLYGVEVT